jgi:hypothetical protein
MDSAADEGIGDKRLGLVRKILNAGSPCDVTHYDGECRR